MRGQVFFFFFFFALRKRSRDPRDAGMQRLFLYEERVKAVRTTLRGAFGLSQDRVVERVEWKPRRAKREHQIWGPLVRLIIEVWLIAVYACRFMRDMAPMPSALWLLWRQSS